MKTGDQEVDLSEQEIVDCSANLGCEGGWLDKSWEYIKEKGGIATEENYPYISEAGFFMQIQHMFGCTQTMARARAHASDA